MEWDMGPKSLSRLYSQLANTAKFYSCMFSRLNMMISSSGCICSSQGFLWYHVYDWDQLKLASWPLLTSEHQDLIENLSTQIFLGFLFDIIWFLLLLTCLSRHGSPSSISVDQGLNFVPVLDQEPWRPGHQVLIKTIFSSGLGSYSYAKRNPWHKTKE